MIYALVLLLLDTTVAHACKVCMISYVFRNVRLNYDNIVGSVEDNCLDYVSPVPGGRTQEC